MAASIKTNSLHKQYSPHGNGYKILYLSSSKVNIGIQGTSISEISLAL